MTALKTQTIIHCFVVETSKRIISASKTKFIFFLPKMYIVLTFLSLVALVSVTVVIYQRVFVKLDTQHVHLIPRTFVWVVILLQVSVNKPS